MSPGAARRTSLREGRNSLTRAEKARDLTTQELGLASQAWWVTKQLRDLDTSGTPTVVDGVGLNNGMMEV